MRLLHAIDRGDCYSSTGVTFKDIQMKGKKLIVEIEPEEGVNYI